MDKRYSFTKLDNVIIEDQNISRSAKAVFTILAKHSRIINGSRVCYLHIKTIAQEAQYAVRTVRYALRALVDLGVVCRNYQFTGDGHNKASLFVVIGANAERYSDFNDQVAEATGTEDSTPVSKTDYPANIAPYHANVAAYNKTASNNIEYSLKSVNATGSEVSSSGFESRTEVVPSFEVCSSPEVTSTLRTAEVDKRLVLSQEPATSNRSDFNPAPLAVALPQDSASLGREPTSKASFRKLSQKERLRMLQEKYCHNLDAVPAAWRPIAEFLLVRTGRAPAALSDDELNAIQTLNTKHTPARVLVEVTKVCERFELNRKPLTGITFCYIEAAMRNQKPTLRKKSEGEKPEVRRHVVSPFDEHIDFDPASSANTRYIIDSKLAMVRADVEERYKNLNEMYPYNEAEMMIFDKTQTQTRKELFKGI